MATSSRIFVKNKALGYVSNDIPLVVRYIERRKESVMVTCVGRHFHTYGSAHLTLLNVSGSHDEDITSLAADRFLVYTASGKKVLAWRMGTQIKHTYDGHEHSVHLLLPFGPNLISIDEKSNLKMWDIKSEELYTELEFDNKSFQIMSVMHPVTYINKILLGSEQGQIQLWNMHTRKLIFTFAGWHSAVMVMEQAPAVDVVAFGLADGRIIIHNLKFDKTLMEFSQDWGSVTGISFRSDGPPMLVSGTGAGHIILWDLEKKSSMGQMWNAHYGPVTGLRCLPSEPIMVTTSPDNSLKMWIFDMPDGSARLLRVREGHSLPPTTIKFHGTEQVFSAGADSSLRVFSTVTETKNHSYGRAVFNRKLFKKVKSKRAPDAPLLMPPVVSLACEAAREKQWDDIAAVHRGLAEVTTWSSDKGRMGDHKLVHSRFNKEFKSAVATCVCVTQCGNFVVIGYSSGHVDRFNMQSGLHRCQYIRPGGHTAHEGATRGVAVEGLNQTVITGGADAMLRFWLFRDGKLLATLSIADQSVAFFTQQKDSSLLAVALDDNSVCIVDMDARSIIRRLPGHTARLTALEFSTDSRWLLIASMDCLVRTWDVPSAHLIDVFRTPSPTTSLSLNSNGSLLATCHVGFLGVFIWCNRALHMHVSLRPIPLDTEAPLLELPMPGECDEEVTELLDEDAIEDYVSPAQLSEQLVTLSTLPTSHWLNVLDLDIVKRRNKPKLPPTAPKAAPFFLPTIASLELEFDVRPSLEEQSTSTSLINDMSALSRSLMTKKMTDTIEMLRHLGPSALDAEVLNLAPEGGGSLQVQMKYIEMLKHLLSQKGDFELGQTYLALFLKHHAEACMEDPQLSNMLENLNADQAWTGLETRLLYCMSIVSAFRKL